MASRFCQTPSTRVRVGSTDWVSVTVPFGFAMTVVVSDAAAVASTDSPVRRACSIAWSTVVPDGSAAGAGSADGVDEIAGAGSAGTGGAAAA
ncbi:hypothetical protein Areg01_58220 [Actinoplanes regularis]|nr:hypothetical protein Areg01_58220 [Actinoplanes regularis]